MADRVLLSGFQENWLSFWLSLETETHLLDEKVQSYSLVPLHVSSQQGAQFPLRHEFMGTAPYRGKDILKEASVWSQRLHA
jgi:hypothetical protein